MTNREKREAVMVMSDTGELAEAFEELAELSEIKGEVRFKINAYRRAAEVVRSHGEELLRLDEIKELRKYHGVGEGIAKKILEFKHGGSILKLEELKKEVPAQLKSLLKIPNLGPKRAKLVYDELGVRTVDELRAAAEEHRLADLPGLGQKAELNILEGIELMQAGSGRLLLQQAYRIQEEIAELMRERIPGLTVSPAGSLRRMKETIGDIDILVSSEESAAVMEAFCSMPNVDRVLMRGETKSSMVTRGGLQVDLRVVMPGEFGAALQYFTGSQSHNVHVREIAKKEGMKMNEYGVFRVAGGRRLAGETEEEVYGALGMELPPPEIREDRGEVEAARAGTLPVLLERGDISGDMHAHTAASDGVASLEEMRKAAEGLGYRYLAITDHAANLKVAGGLERDKLERQVEAIRKMNDAGDSPVTLLAGTELNIGNDGGLDYDESTLSLLDVVVASVHGGFKQDRERITRRIISAMRNPHVKVIAHPTGRLIGQRPAYDVDLRAVMREARETGTALELNAFPDRLDLSGEHLAEARELGVKIAMGTDAHRLEHLGFMLYGVATARRGWLGKGDVLNALDTHELLVWLWEGRVRR
jgi:DNA polymerase (family 10)